MPYSDAQLRQMWQNKQRQLTARPLAEILDRLPVMKTRSSLKKSDQIRAILSEILPAALAEKVIPGPQRAGTLTLLCPDGPTSFELRQREAALLARLQEALGRQAPLKLRMMVRSS